MLAKKKEDLKILLLQVRKDEITQKEELEEFVRYSGLRADQFYVLNVFKTTRFGNVVIDGYDAFFIGGSSDLYVAETEKYDFIENGKELVRYCVKNNIPVFASCFGFQLAIVAFGGTVVQDRENKELGTFPIELTKEGKKDLLFHDTPSPFMTVIGHEQRADSLPKDFVWLVKSDKCKYHAITIKNKPFYAFQFHPEVDRDDFVARVSRYRAVYEDAPHELTQWIKDAAEVPESNKLVSKFVDRVILG